MYTQKSPRGLVLIALLVAAIALVAGCSSSSKKDTTPAGSTINLTASPTTVNTGNTSIIEVTIANGGVGVADQEVAFSVSPSSAGFTTRTCPNGSRARRHWPPQHRRERALLRSERAAPRS
jgi:type IV pilus biogenesis protein CpaD/CtpE